MSSWKPPENVQIPLSLFLDIHRIFQYEYDQLPDRDTWERAKAGIEQKLTKLVNRQLYSEARSADPQDREAAWQKYIDGKLSN